VGMNRTTTVRTGAWRPSDDPSIRSGKCLRNRALRDAYVSVDKTLLLCPGRISSPTKRRCVLAQRSAGGFCRAESCSTASRRSRRIGPAPRHGPFFGKRQQGKDDRFVAAPVLSSPHRSSSHACSSLSEALREAARIAFGRVVVSLVIMDPSTHHPKTTLGQLQTAEV